MIYQWADHCFGFLYDDSILTSKEPYRDTPMQDKGKSMFKTPRFFLYGCWLSVVVMSLLLPPASMAHDNSQEFTEIIKSLKPSVVAVGSLRPAKRTQAKSPPVVFKGSGFVVGNGRYVVTNLHVLPEDLDFEADETLAVFSGRGEQAVGIPVNIVRQDPVHDLVILELQQQQRLPPLKLAGENLINEGVEIAVTGFPIGMVLGLYPVTHQGIVSAITPLVIPAVSSRSLSAHQLRSLRNPFEVYQLDMIAYPGNSGSAVYEKATGDVIGVVNSVFVKAAKESVLENPSGITYAIPIKYVQELIKGLD